eukprot:SAG11_NODE_31592_length_290_cov_1.612565_1_plen_49_part_10
MFAGMRRSWIAPKHSFRAAAVDWSPWSSLNMTPSETIWQRKIRMIMVSM